ncbi:MarR family winged helix-turn-helix transcriptional regulator [Micromonospora sp. NPDC050397]|uniref:MarR family winged helix-turn-helix transcriptional regulator n=1 Tax=Micromonospora sp. NPDC050397 TaxID=3364279 RepID=UPI00384D5A44
MEVHTGLTTRIATQLEQHGLSPVEFEVLMRLTRSPEHRLRMSHLAAQTSLSTSGVTRVVDRMERVGLLYRHACPSDRRSLYAVMTPAGVARLDETLPGHLELIERWFVSQLEPEALQTLLGSLRVLRDAVHPGATAGGGETVDLTVGS